MALWTRTRTSPDYAGSIPRAVWRESGWTIEMEPLVARALTGGIHRPGVLLGVAKTLAPDSAQFEVSYSVALRGGRSGAAIHTEITELLEARAFVGEQPIGFAFPAAWGGPDQIAAAMKECAGVLPQHGLILSGGADGRVSVLVWDKHANVVEPLALNLNGGSAVTDPRKSVDPPLPQGRDQHPPALVSSDQQQLGLAAKAAQLPVAAVPPPVVRLDVTKPAWAVITGLIALGAAGAWYARTNSPNEANAGIAKPAVDAAAKGPLNMGVQRTDGGLEIRWDRQAATGLGAQTGILQIVDGVERSEVSLGRVALETGKVFYTPRFKNVELLLTLFTPSGVVQENIHVLHGGGSDPIVSSLRAPRPSTPSVTGSAFPERAVPPRSVSPPPAQVPAPPIEQTSTAAKAPDQDQPPVPPPASPAKAQPVAIAATPPSNPVASTPKPAPSLPVTAPGEASQPQSSRAVPSGQPEPPPAKVTGPTEPLRAPAAEDALLSSSRPVPPVAIRQVAPVLPTHLRSLVVSSITVEVTAVVDPDGTVAEVRTTPAQGLMAHLTRVSADAVKHWKFKPATVNGRPVQALQVLRFKFGR